MKHATVSYRETADNYAKIVVQLNDQWRIIECRDGVQWILQRKGSPEKTRRDDWRGESYCRTKEALIRSARERAGVAAGVAKVLLACLPEWTEGNCRPIPMLRYGRHTRLPKSMYRRVPIYCLSN